MMSFGPMSSFPMSGLPGAAGAVVAVVRPGIRMACLYGTVREAVLYSMIRDVVPA